MSPKKSLCAINFFLADVRDGLGPFLAIYLLSTQHWTEAKIGIVLTVMGVATLIAQTPAGAFIDKTVHKRALFFIAVGLIAAACSAIMLHPTFICVLSAKVLMGVAAAFLGPTVAAMTLGLVGRRNFTHQIGHNEAFNHMGNVFVAALTGLLSYIFFQGVIFYIVLSMAFASMMSALMINPRSINNQTARGLDSKKKYDASPISFFQVFKLKPLFIFSICVTLFHLANGAMLLLVGQKLAMANSKTGMLSMSACVIVAQIVMIPAALLVGRKADVWGRKPIFLVAFLILPLRGLLYTFSDNAVYLVIVQSLDGVGAGIFGALFLIVIADLTKGTGRYNMSLGAVSTIMGIGASTSNLVGETIVTMAGYNAAFLTLASIAGIALLIFAFFMPETMGFEPKQRRR